MIVYKFNINLKMINKNNFKTTKSKEINISGIPYGFEGYVINDILEINQINPDIDTKNDL